MYAVYILKSNVDDELYTGCTANLKQRLEKHQKGLVQSTKMRRPLRLIYCELCLNESDAFRRESYFKSGIGRRWLKNRLKYYFKEKLRLGQ